MTIYVMFLRYFYGKDPKQGQKVIKELLLKLKEYFEDEEEFLLNIFELSQVDYTLQGRTNNEIAYIIALNRFRRGENFMEILDYIADEENTTIETEQLDKWKSPEDEESLETYMLVSIYLQIKEVKEALKRENPENELEDELENASELEDEG
ncbi:MAG TPA: hypothetical protein PKD00_00635 [Burkholderiales bacterium]|nr:hypothetical protein [Burkholderiales bacterium]